MHHDVTPAGTRGRYGLVTAGGGMGAAESDPPRRALTRRRFLQGLGVVGGAGVVVATMEALNLSSPARKAPFAPPGHADFALQGRVNDTTVLVLGAGVAGLAAAYELEKAGYRCEVLEARQRPGGRNWTVRDGTAETDLDGNTQTARFAEGQYFNPGPARIAQHHTTLDYCRELGVAVEPFANVNADAYFHQEHGSGALTGQPTRHRAARSDLYGYVSELLAKAISQGALDEELTSDDGAAVVEFLRGFGALDTDDRYLGTERRGYATPPGAGMQAGTPIEPFTLTDLLASGFGHHFQAELAWDQAMMMFQPVGGMDRLPAALASALRGRIRYGAEVRGITSTADGVEVIFDDGSGEGTRIEADYCVCTIPPHLLLGAPDEGPTDYFCEMEGPKVGELYEWEALVVMSMDGELHGWGVGTQDAAPPPGVRSDTGVELGATVADLQQTFGAQLDLFTQEWPGEPPQPAFTVGASEDPQGRRLAGWLTGLEPADTITALNVGSPCGP